jgi:hypothetical protein
MQLEFDVLQANWTWSLVSRPTGMNVISGKWVFKNKLHPEGSLKRRKVRWVVSGFKQRPRIDLGHTFSLVIKSTTIHTVLHLAAACNRPVHQFDVKNTFLHDELLERVYCLQPAGFIDDQQPDHVCFLSKFLYGLKQASCAWFRHFGTHLQHAGFCAT